MKKIIIILFLCLFSVCIVKEKVKGAFIEKIDLKLEEKEIGMIFIPIEDSDYLLIRTKEQSILLGINERSGDIHKTLRKLGQNHVDYSLTRRVRGKQNIELKSGFELGQIKIQKKASNYQIMFGKQAMFLYKEGKLQNTKYIYFLKPTTLENTDIHLAFYKEGFPTHFEESLSEHWIDSYKIKTNEFTVVKFTEDSYHVIRIPDKSL